MSLPMDGLPSLRPGSGFDLLAGIRVLDLSTSIAGPYATMLLADMGAEVVKIERPPGGDDARAWGPPFLDGESLWFLSVNRNKQSVVLDYSKPEGLDVLRDLVRHVDVLVANQPHGVAVRLGVDVESMRRVKPDLIYVSITGFGLDGARAGRGCYDLIAEGFSGVMDLTGAADGDPQKVGAPAADMLAGQEAAFAAAAALFSRQRTGRPAVIDVALVDAMVRFLTCRIVPYLGSGDVPHRSGGTDSVIAIYQAFDTADRPITLGLGNDAIWRRFWQAVGEPAVADEAAYRSNVERRANRPAIVERIQALLAARTRAEWLEIFAAARVPAGPINSVDEVTADPELRRRHLFYRLDAGERALPQVGAPVRINGEPHHPRSAPPRLGEHTRRVLSDLLGYNDARMRSLLQAAAIQE